jgi:hypothetical protein
MERDSRREVSNLMALSFIGGLLVEPCRPYLCLKWIEVNETVLVSPPPYSISETAVITTPALCFP